MMPGAFVPVRVVRRRTIVVAVTMIVCGAVHHAFFFRHRLNDTHEGVHWITGHHDPACDALAALRAAEALEGTIHR